MVGVGEGHITIDAPRNVAFTADLRAAGTKPSPTSAGLPPPLDRGVVPGAEHVGQGQQRGEQRFVLASRQLDQRSGQCR
jgi:hypothetical protein